MNPATTYPNHVCLILYYCLCIVRDDDCGDLGLRSLRSLCPTPPWALRTPRGGTQAIDTGKTIAATATLMYSNKFIERREDDLYRDVFNPGYSVVYRDIQNIIEVCKLQAQWILEGRNIPISIGVSASLIGFDGGVKKIKNILKEYKVKERYLEFEISYADLPVNLKQAEINIMAFRDLGVEMTLAEIGRESNE